MTDRYIKTVEGGEETNPDETDAIEIDDGVNSNWVKISNILLKLTSGIFTSGYMATGRLGSGTATSAKYLRGDQAWETPKLDDLATPDDNTDLNASTSNHGLILKATAPSSGIRNVVAIDNAETAYKNTALLDNTAPADLAASASSGTSLIAARRDHVHSNNTVIPIDGWLPISATWTRTGNHTFTVSGDVTTSYRKGTKVRYKDGGAYEYGVIVLSSYSAPNTTVTLGTNTDYEMASATITDKYISHIENPEGFPFSFNFTPANWIGSGSMTYTSVSVSIARWSAIGNLVKAIVVAEGTTGGTASIALRCDSPITTTETVNIPGSAQTRDATTGNATAGQGSIVASTNQLQVLKQDASNYGLGTGRIFRLVAEYKF